MDPFIESSRESTTPNPFNPDACASDPVVQAAVAKLIAGLPCPVFCSLVPDILASSRGPLLRRFKFHHHGLLGLSGSG